MNTLKIPSIIKSKILWGSVIGSFAGTILWPVLIIGLVAGLWALEALRGLLNPTYQPAEFAPLGFLITIGVAIISAPVGSFIGAVSGGLAVVVAKKVRMYLRASEM